MSRFTRILLFFVLFVMAISTAIAVFPNLAAAQGRAFTIQELSEYDGQDGRPAYFAYEGVVYDATGSKLWQAGEHFGLKAGKDLSGMLGNAPHGTEVFKAVPQVGTLSGAAAESAATAAPLTGSMAVETAPESANQAWYQGRIRLLGLSLLGWSGIVLGVFFVLTFATCFALPWGKLPLPWKGARPGPDALDVSPKHKNWSSFHKHFVWFTVIFGVIHGVLGLLQMAGWYL